MGLLERITTANNEKEAQQKKEAIFMRPAG